MAGSAVIVGLQQLKGLLGITHFTKKMALVPVLSSVFHTTDEVRPKFLCSLPYPLFFFFFKNGVI